MPWTQQTDRGRTPGATYRGDQTGVTDHRSHIGLHQRARRAVVPVSHPGAIARTRLDHNLVTVRDQGPDGLRG